MSFISQFAIPASVLAGHIPPQQYLDGMLIPRGQFTLLAVQGGGGKTTAAISAAIRGACHNSFRFFGESKILDAEGVARPVRSVLILGEESANDFARTVHHHMPVDMPAEATRAAIDSGAMTVFSWADMRAADEKGSPVFGPEGALTEHGARLFAALRETRPDFIFFDTLSSLSEGDYNVDSTAYRTIGLLSGLARETGAAVVMTAHLTKDAARKGADDMTSSAMIAEIRGSAQIISAARHAIVLMRAPEKAYPSLQLDEGDELWVGTCKSNLGCPLASKVFPVIRSSSKRTFLAISNAGRPLYDVESETHQLTHNELRKVIPGIIRASAALLHPLADSGSASLQKLAAGPFRNLLPEGATSAAISAVIEELKSEGHVVIVRDTAKGQPLLDVPGGPFASPADHGFEEMPKFRKGVADTDQLVETMRAIERGDHVPVAA